MTGREAVPDPVAELEAVHDLMAGLGLAHGLGAGLGLVHDLGVGAATLVVPVVGLVPVAVVETRQSSQSF